MKKISLILAILSVFTLMVSAQVKVAPRVGSEGSGLYYLNGKKGAVCHMEPSQYLKAGIVPVVNGKVVFSKSIALSGKNKTEIGKLLSGWASTRFMSRTENGYWSDADYYKNCDFAKVVSHDANAGKMICQGDEEQVFSNRTLAKDFARFQYQLTLVYSDGVVTATVSDITYTYDIPEKMTAESFITDTEVITKKGTLNRLYGKFRAKTVDLVNELFLEISKL
ncbi:MAG: DUF4468 domain-containing protein [Prevotellaceae bacterium]|nr:DUF4468 domain-containing protein [Candidatus Colivivens equi]